MVQLLIEWCLLALTVHHTTASAIPGRLSDYQGCNAFCESLNYTTATTNGTVTGHAARNRSDVVEFLGIPYAAPPVGNLRFAPPAAFHGFRDYVASSFSPSCPETPSKPVHYPNETAQGQRIISYFGSQFNHTQSEDCLTLNVWSKPTPRACAAKKPILIYFYGGRWSIGDTITPFYNGQYLASAEDVVVVTINYRINIFGFPGAPGIEQNLAFRDQRKAVEWIADNAAAFGGDASKIVIMGQSSGSVAVSYYSYTYAKDPIVSGYISSSGNEFSFPTNNASLAAKHWYNASAILGCGSSGDVLPCMRNQTWQAVEKAGSQVRPPPTGSLTRTQPAFQPVIDSTTVLTTDEYVERLKTGQFSKLPYLLGNNNNEAGYYKVAAYAQGIVLPESAWDQFNAESFTCPNTYDAYHRRMQNVPVWLFRYFGDWANLRLYPTSGAYHGTLEEMLFGASADVSGLPDSAAEKQTQALVMHAWATFADDPVNGLKRLGWPTFDYSQPTLVELAYNNTPKARFVPPSVFDNACSGVNLTFPYDVPS
ncbi:hypothetical protein MBLNU457_7241t1 [Dothideomycetes sp. NU457]